MSSEVIDLTVEAFLPGAIKQDWLPHNGLSVLHLFQFTRYPPPAVLYYEYTDLSQQLHEIIFDPELETLLHLGPPSPRLSDKYRASILAAPSPIHSFTLVPLTGEPVQLPTWVLDYWGEIEHAVGYRHQWKMALIWLRQVSDFESMAETCTQVMAGLSFFPWNGGCCSVNDMVIILSDSWLNSFHIDYTLMKISGQYSDHLGDETPSRHAFLTVGDLDSIIEAYKKVKGGNSANK